MRAGNGADVVDLEQPPGSISPHDGHERLGTFRQRVTLGAELRERGVGVHVSELSRHARAAGNHCSRLALSPLAGHDPRPMQP